MTESYFFSFNGAPNLARRGIKCGDTKYQMSRKYGTKCGDLSSRSVNVVLSLVILMSQDITSLIAINNLI